MRLETWLAHDMNGGGDLDHRGRPIEPGKWYVLLLKNNDLRSRSGVSPMRLDVEARVYAGPFEFATEAELARFLLEDSIK